MAGVSKLEYLKRYMDDDKKKLKKKKKVKKHSNIRIIDNSVTLKDLKTYEHCEVEFELKEDKPILYAKDGTTVLNEEYNEKEKLKKERWKSIHSDKVDSSDESSKKNISVQKQKRQRHDSSDDDMSPVRQKGHQDNDTSDSDLSPIRDRGPREDSDEDLSPVRKKIDNSGGDLSPVRDRKSSSVQRNEIRNTSRKRKELLPEVLSTGKSGLRTGTELREENEMKRKHENEVMKSLGSNVTGKGAETVYRDKQGKKIDLKLEAIAKQKVEEEKLKQDEKYAKWGKGLAQNESYKQQLQDDLHEMDKPLARHKDDKDLDALLKETVRAGDPMAAFITKNKKEEKPGRPRYSGPVPPNRFNIWPGYRYDGVDRSNGFEKQRFQEMSKRKGFKDAAYKWSVEDM